MSAANKYKVLLPLVVKLIGKEFGEADTTKEYTQGDVFEREFGDDWTPDMEQANLNSGLLELQPNTYKVVGDSNVLEHKPGDVFEAVVPMGQEELLVAGGHIERVEAKKPASKAAAKKKED